MNTYWSHSKASALNHYTMVIFTLEKSKEPEQRHLDPFPVTSPPQPMPPAHTRASQKRSSSSLLSGCQWGHSSEVTLGGGAEVLGRVGACREGALLEDYRALRLPRRGIPGRGAAGAGGGQASGSGAGGGRERQPGRLEGRHSRRSQGPRRPLGGPWLSHAGCSVQKRPQGP